ncbi:MAG: sortase [Candidatus Peribacteraceae bacterium]|nr:sortase [Candidatus Peribacteraceae bacterium]MDD5075238.1 sortase [Candidatus Peribacteraceae bacterium]
MHFKRLFTTIPAILLLLTGFAPTASAVTFSDAVGTVYDSSFSYLSDRNIIQGYSDGSGRPDSPLNRAEALKVVLNLDSETQSRVTWFQSHMPPLSLFTDVSQSEWYAPYVETAFEKNLITGYPDGSLRPGQLLRVEEAVALLMRSTGEDSKAAEPADLSLYIENRGNEWFTSSINAAVRKNLIMHYGRLRLNAAITRGQFFDMAYRLHSIRAGNETAYTGHEPADLPPSLPMHARDSEVAAGGFAYGSEKYFAISMPSLGISDLTITHPQDPFSKEGIMEPLQYGVGHLFGYPGAGGKAMIYGHSSGYPWDLSQFTKIFRQINKLKQGDRVYVTYEGTVYTYEVTYNETVEASDTSPFNDNGSGEELILYTCWPPDSISQRYLVHALPVGAVAAR